jgi:tRNA-modifying protein YgfZ
MMPTIENTLPSAQNLPENYLIQVTDLSAITLSGEEQSSYLQGQVTCDVNQLTTSALLHGAHCDAKGKMFSIFRLFNRDNSHWLLQPKKTVSASLAALQKFGVFAKVNISQAENYAFYAVVGKQAELQLKQHFQRLPDSMSPVVQCGSTTLLYIASIDVNVNQRYLLIDQANTLSSLISQFNLPVYQQPLWTLNEIQNGFPIMSESSIGEYVPQMLNVQAINGISFTKGCYLGQETVARMQYLGRNKRALFILTAQLNEQIAAESLIELQLGENWRRAGNILSYYQADNGNVYMQAVLASDINSESTLRLALSDKQYAPLTIQTLPYSLNTENN